jgi:hypothetical protein
MVTSTMWLACPPCPCATCLSLSYADSFGNKRSCAAAHPITKQCRKDPSCGFTLNPSQVASENGTCCQRKPTGLLRRHFEMTDFLGSQICRSHSTQRKSGSSQFFWMLHSTHVASKGRLRTFAVVSSKVCYADTAVFPHFVLFEINYRMQRWALDS